MAIAAIEKRESPIKYAFFERFDQLFPPRLFYVMQHQDVRRSGHPDSSIHGYGQSTFWEFKHATPNFTTNELQELTCWRLARHAYCRYVLFYEYGDELKTLIVHPREVFKKKGKLADMHVEAEFVGHNFDMLAGFIHAIHNPPAELP